MNMLQDLMCYLYPAIIVCTSYLAVVIYVTRKKKEIISWCHLIFLFILAIYLTIIFSVTVSPVYGFSAKIPDFNRVNFIPFKVLKTISSNPLNFFGNIVMFMPFGSLLVLLSKKYQKFYITILAGANLSFLIETLQLFGTRGPDIDDLLLNIIGTICGYCIGIFILAAYPSSQLKLGILIKKNGKTLSNKAGNISVLITIILFTVIATGFFELKDYSNTPTDENSVNSEEDIIIDINNENTSNSIPLKPAVEMNVSTLYAKNAYLLDVKADIILYEKESDEQIAPASTTKMLTAITVLDYCDPDEEVVVGEEIYLRASDASKIWLSVGDKLTVKQLLDGLLLPSGSDAAYALAVYTGRKISANNNISIQDALATFITTMNKKAIISGATHSNFINPDGYDAQNQFTTAYDLAYIAKIFMENTVLGTIASSLRIQDVWLNGNDVTYVNTNQLINPDSSYYYKDVIGLKTGTTGDAGHCLVSAAKMNGTIYICVVMGSSEEGRWLDSIELYQAIK